MRFAATRAGKRDLLCVVEQPRDLMALEQSGAYRGLYHVLLGRILAVGRRRPRTTDHRAAGPPDS